MISMESGFTLLSYFIGSVAELANAPALKAGVRKDMWDRDLPLSFY